MTGISVHSSSRRFTINAMMNRYRATHNRPSNTDPPLLKELRLLCVASEETIPKMTHTTSVILPHSEALEADMAIADDMHLNLPIADGSGITANGLSLNGGHHKETCFPLCKGR